MTWLPIETAGVFFFKKKPHVITLSNFIKDFTVLKILRSAKYSKQNLLLHTAMVFDLAMMVFEHLTV